MSWLGRTCAGVGLALLLYLAAFPVPIEPASWHAPKAPSSTGVFASNGALAGAELLAPDVPGPEAIAADVAGNLYTGALDGRVVRVDVTGAVHTLANTGGRPIGLDVLDNGDVIVADALRGLLRVTPDGRVQTLADGYAGKRFGMVDDVKALPGDRVLFTDASSRHGLDHYQLDALEHRPSGRLFAYDLPTRKVTLVLGGLYFANGVAVSPDGSYALVNETWAYRVRRVFLSGPRKGQNDIVIDNLPGFPDNVTYDRNHDVFWIALASPRDRTVDALCDWPSLRKVIARLPRALQPAPKRHAMAVAIRGDGELVGFFDDPRPTSYSPVTSVLARGDVLYLGSLSHAGIALVKRPATRATAPGR